MSSKFNLNSSSVVKKMVQGNIDSEQPETSKNRKKSPEKSESKTISVVGKEPKSQRVNLVIKPSVYDAAKKKCKKLGVSFNDCMNQLLEGWIDE